MKPPAVRVAAFAVLGLIVLAFVGPVLWIEFARPAGNDLDYRGDLWDWARGWRILLIAPAFVTSLAAAATLRRNRAGDAGLWLILIGVVVFMIPGVVGALGDARLAGPWRYPESLEAAKKMNAVVLGLYPAAIGGLSCVLVGTAVWITAVLLAWCRRRA